MERSTREDFPMCAENAERTPQVSQQGGLGNVAFYNIKQRASLDQHLHPPPRSTISSMMAYIDHDLTCRRPAYSKTRPDTLNTNPSDEHPS